MAFSPASNDKRNFEYITVACVDFIKLPLKDILESHIKPVDLFKEIKSCSALLSGKRKLHTDQLKCCFLPSPDYSKFDVTLLYTLIRNLCPSIKPTKGWGFQPDDADIQIGDDIERLRMFRNNYYAHATSAKISDTEFNDIWENLKSVVNRIQANTGHSVDYSQKLLNIQSFKTANNHFEECKYLLELLPNKQPDKKDEPKIFLSGVDRVICGGTARFGADVRNVEFSRWHLTWQKRTGNSVDCIYTNQEKYKGSTNMTLFIHNVCKEDEGKYQAVLSRESDEMEYKISSKSVYLHALGELPILNDLKVTTGDEGINIHYNYEVLKESPEVKHIKWCKNNKTLDKKSGKYNGGSLNDNCFTITSPTEEDRGKYSCTITNAVGSVSKEVIFDLPNITPISVETTTKNNSVTLVGNVFVYDGSPDILEVFWTKNGEKIHTEVSGGRLSTVTVDNPKLTIRDVSHIDAGEYKLTARNAVGETSSDIIVLGAPNVHLERLQNENYWSQCFTVAITATPAPCRVQWSKKDINEDEFRRIDVDAEEYRGTTNYLPHPKLVVKDRNLLENNWFQIEVSNFVGSTVAIVAGHRNPPLRKSIDESVTSKYFMHNIGPENYRKPVTLKMAQAYPFSKGTNPKDVLTSILKADVSRSVGLIYVEGQPYGTGFRVGSKYIITCAHVLTEVRVALNVIDNTRVFIEFERIEYTNREDPNKKFDFQPTVAYSDAAFDVAVLELKQHCHNVSFPPPLTHFCEINESDIHLIGHPGGRQMKEDSDVTPKWLPDHSEIGEFIDELSRWSVYYFPGGVDYYRILKELPRKIMFHTTFDRGASGSPGFVMKNGKPYVVLMLSAGTPKCFYEDPFLPVPLENDKRIEFGYAICDIFKKMWHSTNANDKNLACELFKLWG